MSLLIEQAAEAAQTEIVGDLPPVGHRTNEVFSRFIREARKAEANLTRDWLALNARLHKCQEMNSRLVEENAKLKGELLTHRIQANASSIGLDADQAALLLTKSSV